MWLLKTPEGASAPFAFRIPPGRIKTIGRAAGADFIVDATRVSRLHCRISAGAAELQVEDLDSTNGTYVNGARVDRAALRTGDTLGVGEVEFVISRRDS
jgi:pSer/pThr/pTyr-binding forkhead associated (FHA) protein